MAPDTLRSPKCKYTPEAAKGPAIPEPAVILWRMLRLGAAYHGIIEPNAAPKRIRPSAAFVL